MDATQTGDVSQFFLNAKRGTIFQRRAWGGEGVKFYCSQILSQIDVDHKKRKSALLRHPLNDTH